MDDAHVRWLRQRRGDERPLSRTCSQGNRGLSIAFDMPTLYGYDHGAPVAQGEFGKCGVACRLFARHGSTAGRAPAGRGHDVDDDQRAGRSSGRCSSRPPRGAASARRLAARRRTTSSRSSSRRTSSSSRRAVAAPGRRHDRVRVARDAEVEPDQRHRLPHPRGRLDSGAGAGVHAGERDRVRAVGAGARPRHRRLRAAAGVLLQLPQRLLRGDREVPRGAAHLGARDARDGSARRTRARG